jgi:hypothetical protein
MEIQSEHAGGSRALPRISLTPEEAAASTGFSVRLCTPQPVFNAVARHTMHEIEDYYCDSKTIEGRWRWMIYWVG